MQHTPSDTQIVEAQKRQVQALTGADIGLIVFNELGWTSRVYIVDGGQFVVKFPRQASVKKEYAQEVKIYTLLKQLQHPSVQVPRLRLTHPDNDYIGYEGIEGVELDSVAKSLSEQELQTIGKAIGGFLKQLHTLDLEDPYVVGVDAEIKQFQEAYKDSLSVLQKQLPEAALTKIDTFINHDMPAEMLRLGSKPVLCHGDLGYWNIILKPDGQIGVIDFGDVGYYDQSKDLCGLSDAASLDAALAEYGDSAELRQKIAIRQQSIPFLDLRYYTKKNDEANIRKTVATISANLPS
jgi:aminoglycoside phosphotransferase (APT) family kinase protein